MKVVVLAGGKGTRLSADRPKPMVEIGGIPVISHVMNTFKKYGYKEFIIATGYKSEYFQKYFEDESGVTCLYTGIEPGTAQRIRECALHIPDEYFLCAYGDSPANVDIDALLRIKRGIVTLTAVHPPPRYGRLVLQGSKVCRFTEKQADPKDWVNGGFFVINTEFACTVKDVSWEFDVLPKLAVDGKLMAYKHPGFWVSMDTQKDVDYLNDLWIKGVAPWA